MIGKVVATAEGKEVATADLVALAEVQRSGWFLSAWQHVTGLFKK